MSKQEELNDAIDEAVEAAVNSVGSYAQFAKDANAQLNGDAPAETGAWLNLGAQTYARAVSDGAAVWAAGLQVLGILAREDD